MAAVHSPLHNEMARKHVARRSVWIPDYTWNNHLDPIDKEIYGLLLARFPKGYSAEQLLHLLKEMEPEENEEYVLQDVWDALDISLKDFVMRKGKRSGFWVLKEEQDENQPN